MLDAESWQVMFFRILPLSMSGHFIFSLTNVRQMNTSEGGGNCQLHIHVGQPPVTGAYGIPRESNGC
uniref:Uncharacterized protein n=1 Tax=Anguilla anguilla TaxID=7936 RepID=A0A0E9V6G4_ANGAN